MSGLKDQALMAYVDGELEGAQKAALEAAIAKDPELAREVERQRRLRAGVQDAFADTLDEPVPDRLAALIAAGAAHDEPLVLRPQTGRSRRRTGGFRAAHWVAMAASLAVGVALGLGAGLGSARLDSAPIATEQGRLVAQGGLAEALTAQLAGDPAGEVRVGLSFRSRDQGLCRTFVVSDPGLAGLACRQGERWRVLATAEAPAAAEGGYRMAGSATPAPILAAVEEIIAGEPLEAPDEAAARQRGWRE
jgi:hypothetical protein